MVYNCVQLPSANKTQGIMLPLGSTFPQIGHSLSIFFFDILFMHVLISSAMLKLVPCNVSPNMQCHDS